MARRPALEKYPHLHSLLKKDALANTQFNEALRGLQIPVSAAAPEDNAALEKLQTQYSDVVKKYNDQLKYVKKTHRLIRILGGIIETQCRFTPYADDIAQQKSYSIKFSADKIRMLLHLHWDIIATKSEEILLGVRQDDDDDDEDPEEET